MVTADMLSVENGTITVTRVCPLCNEEVVLPGLSPWQLDIWISGEKIQDAFPQLSPEDREILISGTHPACFDRAFGGE